MCSSSQNYETVSFCERVHKMIPPSGGDIVPIRFFPDTGLERGKEDVEEDWSKMKAAEKRMKVFVTRRIPQEGMKLLSAAAE